MSRQKDNGKRTRSPAYNDTSAVKLSYIREVGDPSQGIRVLRLLANDSLTPQLAAQSVEAAVPCIEEFKAQLLITPGAFGIAELPFRYSEEETCGAVQGFLTDFLKYIPTRRNFDIILGVDGGKPAEGWLQEAYFIPSTANSIGECQRVWKSYPLDGESYLYTRGRACSGRVVDSYGVKISVLVCHDLAAFSSRSQATRDVERDKWAKQLAAEVVRGPNTGVVHLIHYLETVDSGKVFANGMKNLVKDGVGWGISAFRTSLDPTSDSDGLRKLEERTARFAGLILDIYVEEV